MIQFTLSKAEQKNPLQIIEEGFFINRKGVELI